MATPATACGSSTLQWLRPNTRMASPATQRETGGLSTEMNEALSNDPNSHAVQSSEPLYAAAA